MARKVDKHNLVKDWANYRGWQKDQCHWYKGGYGLNNCTNPADPASKNLVYNKFCKDHWWICSFCDQKFPTYKTGRIKSRCDCKKSKDYIKGIEEEKNVRTIARELITQSMAKVGIECSWHPSGTGKFTLYLTDSRTRCGVGGDITLTIKDESKGSVVLGDRYSWNGQNLALDVIDPDYATKACGFLIERVLKTSNERLKSNATNLYTALSEIEIIHKNIQTILPSIRDHDDKSWVEQWQKIQTDVETFSTYLKDSVPEVEKIIGGLLNQDLESH